MCVGGTHLIRVYDPVVPRIESQAPVICVQPSNVLPFSFITQNRLGKKIENRNSLFVMRGVPTAFFLLIYIFVERLKTVATSAKLVRRIISLKNNMLLQHRRSYMV